MNVKRLLEILRDIPEETEILISNETEIKSVEFYYEVYNKQGHEKIVVIWPLYTQ
jgi:hypothetical protein